MKNLRNPCARMLLCPPRHARLGRFCATTPWAVHNGAKRDTPFRQAFCHSGWCQKRTKPEMLESDTVLSGDWKSFGCPTGTASRTVPSSRCCATPRSWSRWFATTTSTLWKDCKCTLGSLVCFEAESSGNASRGEHSSNRKLS